MKPFDLATKNNSYTMRAIQKLLIADGYGQRFSSSTNYGAHFNPFQNNFFHCLRVLYSVHLISSFARQL